MFTKTEGILPAPEATHALVTVFQEAEKCKKEGVSRTILFNLCGHGYFDMSAYQDYFEGKLHNHEVTKEEIEASLAQLDTPVPA